MARIRERPIFIYHQIGDYPADMMQYGVTPAAFRSHLGALEGLNLEAIPLDRMLAQMKGEAPFSPRAVSFTFDGGFRDAAENALPILIEKNIEATFFIPAEYVGKEHALYRANLPCMDWGQIRELLAAGMTIGSLGRYGARLTEMKPSEWREDARTARRTLEDKLGVPVRYHAYRETFPNRRLRKWFIEEGFEAVLTMCPTLRRPSLYRIGRIQVDDEAPNVFQSKASNLYLFFKDKRAWRLIRKFKVDRLMHRIYERFEK
jgi:peptidoglycan/xylan/chitin deacetylase (PgdA/CDA1 family)